MPVAPVFLAGVVTAAVGKKFAKGAVRGVVKTSMKVGIDAKRAAHSINEELHDIAAEASTELLVDDIAQSDQKNATGGQTPRQAKK